MAENTWEKFSQKILINAPMQKVYDAWTTQNRLESWFLRLAQFTNANGVEKRADEKLVTGDKYHWRWHGHPDSVEEFGTVLEANGMDRFKFTFGNAGNVTVKLKSEEGRTLMEIVQDNIPTDEQSKFDYYVGCSTGWTFFRLNLKSILEGGIDLRNKISVHAFND